MKIVKNGLKLEFFNVEEETVTLFNLRGKYNTPTSLRDILEDKEEQKENIKNMLMSLSA